MTTPAKPAAKVAAPKTLSDASQELQDAAAKLGVTELPEGKPKADLPKRARVRSLVGEMRHLYTDMLITSDDKRIDIDEFAAAQIGAGKWEIVED